MFDGNVFDRDVSDGHAGSPPGEGPTGALATLDRWRSQEASGRLGGGPAGGPAVAEVLAGREASWQELLDQARALERDQRFADLDDDGLAAAVGRQAARVAAATAEYLALVAEVLARDLWAAHGARTPAHWLSHEVGVGTSTAKEHVRVAVRLRHLPRIRARFAAGEVSYTKVRAITRIAVPELEPLLLAWCQVMTGAEVERTVRGFRRSADPGGLAANGRAPGRSWRRRSNGDGTSTLTIVALDEEVDELEQLCQAYADLDRGDDAAGEDGGGSAEAPAEADGSAATADRAEAPAEADGSAATADRAEAPAGAVPAELSAAAALAAAGASAEAVRAAAEDDARLAAATDADTRPHRSGSHATRPLTADGDGTPGPRATPDARDDGMAGGRGGMLVTALVHLTAEGADGRSDTTGLDRWTLNLHVDAHDLAPSAAPAGDAVAGHRSGGASAGAGGPSWTDADAPRGASAGAGGRADHQVPVWSTTGRTRWMSASTLRRLACEAGIVVVVDGADGTPLDVGRRRREPTASQRRALLARDRGCRFPGCGATRHLHAHHVVFWADDGPTDMSNLVTLCSYHHRFVHVHDWRIVPAAAGTFRFARPDGSDVPTARPLPGADDTWTYDAAEDRPLRPRHRDGTDDLDLHHVVEVLHQQLRRATGTSEVAVAA